MLKLKEIKNSYVNLKSKCFRRIENSEERYMISMLDEAIENLKNGGGTISLEDWREEMRRIYNVSI